MRMGSPDMPGSLHEMFKPVLEKDVTALDKVPDLSAVFSSRSDSPGEGQTETSLPSGDGGIDAALPRQESSPNPFPNPLLLLYSANFWRPMTSFPEEAKEKYPVAGMGRDMFILPNDLFAKDHTKKYDDWFSTLTGHGMPAPYVKEESPHPQSFDLYKKAYWKYKSESLGPILLMLN